MKFNCGDGGCGVVVRDGERLATGSGTTVENAGSLSNNRMAYEGGDEL
jgi:ribonuclease HI